MFANAALKCLILNRGSAKTAAECAAEKCLDLTKVVMIVKNSAVAYFQSWLLAALPAKKFVAER